MAEAASALATELLRCEGRKMTRGRRWAGPARWAGQLGQFWWTARVRPGKLGFSLSLSLSLFYCFLFLFCFI